MLPVWPLSDRRRLNGRFDKGDLINTGDWTVECKNAKEIRLSEALTQAEVESRNAGTRWHAAIINRRNHATAKGYVLMTLEQFKALLVEDAKKEQAIINQRALLDRRLARKAKEPGYEQLQIPGV
jgi:hypothetical protein